MIHVVLETRLKEGQKYKIHVQILCVLTLELLRNLLKIQPYTTRVDDVPIWELILKII